MFDEQIEAAKPALAKAAAKTAAAAPKTPNALVTFFLSVFMPVLPQLLMLAAPRILTSAKFLAVLRKVNDVIGQILEQAEPEPEV